MSPGTSGTGCTLCRPIWVLTGTRELPYNRTGLVSRLDPKPRAQVAQSVEHLTENQGVGGSIPPLGTI